MLLKEDFEKLLRSRGTLIVDGALASELETRGHDLNHPLWSAKLLKENPESIQKVHFDYYTAGADIAITASYQAATAGLYGHFGLNESHAKDLIRRSVELAQSAREAAYHHGVDSSRRLLVAGSVGPYGAYLSDGSEYTGDYALTPEQFKDFHRPRIQALLEAGVDLLAIETIPSLGEIMAILDMMQREFPHALAWISCTSRSSDQLCDGTPWGTVIEAIHRCPDQIVAFGINCVAMAGAANTLANLVKLTQLPLVCYPNSGEIWDAETKTWHGDCPDDKLVDGPAIGHNTAQKLPIDTWTANGARLIGGCCRTGPSFIEAISNSLKLEAQT